MRSRLALVALTAALATGCASKPETGALDVRVVGCATVSSDGTCFLPERDASVHVFVASASPLEARATRGAVAVTLEESFDEGRRYALSFARDAGRISLRAVRAGTSIVDEAGFDVRPDHVPLWTEEEKALRARGDFEGALRVLGDAMKGTDPTGAYLALRRAARTELARGHVEESAALFRSAIARGRENGRTSDIVEDAFALSFALCDRGHRCGEAREVLDGVRDLVPRYAYGWAREPHYRSVVLSNQGDRRAALRLLREAERRTSLLGALPFQVYVHAAMARELDRMGRYEDALDRRRRDLAALASTPGGADADARRMLENGIGFGLLMLAQSRSSGSSGSNGPGELREAEEMLTRADHEEPCRDPYLRAAVVAHLAEVALLSGQPDVAATRIARARELAPTPSADDSFAWQDLEGRIALARRDAKRARAIYEELEGRARAALRPDALWTALHGRGQAEEMRGADVRAYEAYVAADACLDDASFAVPIGEGRARYLTPRERSATAGIKLALRLGRVDDAFQWARRVRRRLLEGLAIAHRLQSLDAQGRARWESTAQAYAQERAEIDAATAEDWRYSLPEIAKRKDDRAARERTLRASVEELASVLSLGNGRRDATPRAPAGAELWIAFSPDADGYLEFAATARGTQVFRVPRIDPGMAPAELSRALLGPIRPLIEASDGVRIFSAGELDDVDFHALPYLGGPGEPGERLLDRLPVEYALDIGDASDRLDPDSVARSLVVGNPGRDLPMAAREATLVGEALAGMGAEVSRLHEKSATHGAIVSALEGASLFHYAGHASTAGEDGWESYLPLAGGGRLTVSDVLTLRHAPEAVVLLGCSAAATERGVSSTTLGVAQAFLVVGSSLAVAPVRNVDDALSADFAARLYEALGKTPGKDLARAARAALLAMAKEDATGGWAAFRVMRR